MTVWLTRVIDDESMSFPLHTAIHATRAAAETGPAAWCRTEWVARGCPDGLPDDDAAAVAAFFEFWYEEHDYTIEEHPVEGL